MNLTRRNALWLIGGTFARLAVPVPVLALSERPIVCATLTGELGAYRGLTFAETMASPAGKLWARRLYNEALRESVALRFMHPNPTAGLVTFERLA